jgi:GT2 family glycosyltransferase
MTPVSPATIGVVTVNWNRPGETIACLDALRRATPGPGRAIVVDNASSDSSVETLHGWADQQRDLPTTVLRMDTNLGYAGGLNRGIAELVRDPALTHFLLLNNDTTVDPGFFAAVQRGLVVARDGAVLGPTIYTGPTRSHVWYAGGRLPRGRALVAHGRVVPPPPREDPVPTEFVTGGAMLIARSTWETLGTLPECYFMYFEDTEYSCRARAAGLRVLYLPGAVVHHAGGSTVRLVSDGRNEYWFSRSRALFVRRNMHGWLRWGAIGYLLVSRPLRSVLDLLRGKPSVALAGLTGTLRGLLAVEGDGEVRVPATGERRRDGVVVNE